MSDVLDRLVEELEDFSSPYGTLTSLEIKSVQKGDPGFVVSDEYPFLMVQAGTIGPKLETIGKGAGYQVLSHQYAISIMVDATDYFDPQASGNDAEGPLEDAAIAMWLWFARVASRKLEPLEGIRDVKVGSVDFLPDERGEVYARRALLMLTVERRYQHQP